ncbi:hypothetical protein TWF569_011967 [Orbilia oligospora]|uniref:Uncharacterized protein n=1 Tax=Orbilia oligospora TaxID=2813651 RepID=A0A7C8JHY5_ORBOL|nr:hypothetical protein TWF102_012023 [Orbilia oligospora]KAF3103339.1 hypothetical protein TWF706_012004 [Orbilia oligospora]KAF3108819.1 hypothetical protein TWF103_012010 [Orbilia oligospora]KAF3129467.1 hypothetical protein TWF594_011892 [Orbilia oligospora]KAF3148176.1 hypothetical protein TWF569_011967 [Orbilia oligospora]
MPNKILENRRDDRCCLLPRSAIIATHRQHIPPYRRLQPTALRYQKTLESTGESWPSSKQKSKFDTNITRRGLEVAPRES